MKKVVPDAPHEVLLVLDGSTRDKTAFEQAKQLRLQPSEGFAVTKLDGTAKGGVVDPVFRIISVSLSSTLAWEKEWRISRFSIEKNL